MIYLVVYDIKDVKRLAKISKYLSSVGLRVQNSTFELDNRMLSLPMNQLFSHLVSLCKEGDRVYMYQVKKKQDIQLKTDDWEMVL
jgi:CRISPR-associated endonuclease Cas2